MEGWTGIVRAGEALEGISHLQNFEIKHFPRLVGESRLYRYSEVATYIGMDGNAGENLPAYEALPFYILRSLPSRSAYADLRM